MSSAVRAMRRRALRDEGYRGKKALHGMPTDEVLKRAVLAIRRKEASAYIEKTTEAARRTREMGLVIPGQ